MTLNGQLAQSLCDQLMATLLNQSDALLAALQAGGHERKMEGWVQQGMSQWLTANANHLVCITEFRKMDFAFVARNSVGQNNLLVDTFFEAKANYASQNPELLTRPEKAAKQLRGYQAATPNADGYLLYLLADHANRDCPSSGDDKGWRYVGRARDGRLEVGANLLDRQAELAGLGRLAETSDSLPGWLLRLAIYRCSEVPTGAEHQIDPHETRGDIVDVS